MMLSDLLPVGRSGSWAVMKAQDFWAFVEQLGEFSELQRAALQAALAGKGSANEAVALIETRFAADPGCGHGGSKSFGQWGSASGLRRHRCKDCRLTFNALTGTPLTNLAAGRHGSSLPARSSIGSACARPRSMPA